jgi:hypothetical protein
LFSIRLPLLFKYPIHQRRLLRHATKKETPSFSWTTIVFNNYGLGQSVRVRSAFQNAGRKASNPEALKLTIKSPSGEISTVVFGDPQEGDVTQINQRMIGESPVPGEFYADIDANEPGVWFYRWWSTGELQAAAESRFEVREAHAIEQESG